MYEHFSNFAKLTPQAEVKGQILTKFDPKITFLACRAGPACPNWTKIGTNKGLDHKNKHVQAFFKFCKKLTSQAEVKGQILTKFDPKITF